MKENLKQLHIFITGRVQGVFFRDNTKRVAENLNLKGFAKNLQDGRVEIVAQGEDHNLRKLLDWCYRGSLLSKVEGLSFEWEESGKENVYKKFKVEKGNKTFIEDKADAAKNLGKRVVNRIIGKVPEHLVIIPDGNRRWAKEQGMDPWIGHKKALDQISNLSKEIRENNIKYTTFWGFSTENWKRDEKEINELMKLFKIFVKKFRKEALENEIRFYHFGRKDRLPEDILKLLADLEEDTKEFNKYHVALALDYGGRDEIIRAINKIQKREGEITEFTEEMISEALDTKEFPDPDLIIRTSGEQRTSGMMPWQGAYAEYYFSPLHFPEFSSNELKLAIDDFGNRKRRFGGQT